MIIDGGRAERFVFRADWPGTRFLYNSWLKSRDFRELSVIFELQFALACRITIRNGAEFRSGGIRGREKTVHIGISVLNICHLDDSNLRMLVVISA